VRVTPDAENRKWLDLGGDLGLVCLELELGGPAHAIAAIADETGADLIVAGRRGHSRIRGLLLGSVTQRLLQVAHQPVLVVPHEK
jgi:nucleotide-binding universal stress UspA family protein